MYHHEERKDSPLSTFETCLACLLYVGTVIVALFRAFEFSRELSPDEYAFSGGWWFLKRPRDDSDDEWMTITDNIRSDGTWLLAHAFFSEIVRYLKPTKVPVCHAIVGIVYVLYRYHLEPITLAFIVAMNLLHYASARFGKRYVWLVTVFWLIVLNLIKRYAWSEWVQGLTSPDKIYSGLIMVAWLLLRTTSFAAEYCDAKETMCETNLQKKFSLWKYLGYTFYIPVYQHGPPLIYERYEMCEINVKTDLEETADRFADLFHALLRIGAIYLFTELISHFIYINVVIYNPELITKMSAITMYGFGYAIGQFFCNKYMVAYGLSIALARFDRIDAPDGPRCIGRIHLYSHMWRYFDQGLYDFLFRHIYCELCSRTSPFWQKLLAGLVSFTFIYLWHGYYMFLFAWVLLNSVLLCMEQLQRKLFDKYRATLQRSIGDQNIQRLNAIIGSQLVLPSIITNLMFIGGPDIGLYLAERTYLTDGLLNYILLSFVAYNFYQYSSSVCAREQRSQRSQHREHTN